MNEGLRRKVLIGTASNLRSTLNLRPNESRLELDELYTYSNDMFPDSTEDFNT
jgi:hypothetical protein